VSSLRPVYTTWSLPHHLVNLGILCSWKNTLLRNKDARGG